MSNLEHLVSPILGPMILNGKPTALSPGTQKDLAFWAVKTALVLDQFSEPSRHIPDAEYRALYAMQQPLSSHMVWSSHRNNTGPAIASALKGVVNQVWFFQNQPEAKALLDSEVAQGRTMYGAGFAIGHVAFLVMGHNFSTALDFHSGPNHALVAHRIWPVTGPVVWPPGHSIDEVGGFASYYTLIFGQPGLPPAPPPKAWWPGQPSRKVRRAAQRTAKKRQRP